MKTIKVVCCDCGKVIRDGDLIDGKVSHSYCEPCYDKVMNELKREDNI